MSLEAMENGRHVSDEMKEEEGAAMPFSLEELQTMGVPEGEIQAFVAEYTEIERTKEWEIQELVSHIRSSTIV